MTAGNDTAAAATGNAAAGDAAAGNAAAGHAAAGNAAASQVAPRIRVCFVCLGNICRSPTAHGVMQRMVAGAGLASAIAIDSAGTADYHVGELPDERTRRAARSRGLELDHRARQFVAADLDRFDLVVAMDRQNLRRLQQLAAGRRAPPLVLLRSFDPTAEPGAEVPDPWQGGEPGFEQVLDQCERACAGLLAQLQERLREPPREPPGEPLR